MSGAGPASHSVKSEPSFLTSSLLESASYSAVILAGGEGIRLSPHLQKLYGFHVPKQFCPLFGGKTLLEETMRRVSLLVTPSQTITVLKDPKRLAAISSSRNHILGGNQIVPGSQSFPSTANPEQTIAKAFQAGR